MAEQAQFRAAPWWSFPRLRGMFRRGAGPAQPTPAAAALFPRRTAAAFAQARPGPADPVVADAERLLNELDRRLAAVPPDMPRAAEVMWGICAALVRADQFDLALQLWSRLRRIGNQECRLILPMAERLVGWLAADSEAMAAATLDLAALAIVEALDAIRSDSAAQNRLLAPIQLVPALLTREVPAGRVRVLDALLALAALMPQPARRQLENWRELADRGRNDFSPREGVP